MEWTCKHCKIEFKGLKQGEKIAHSKFCEKNPNRKRNLKQMEKARKVANQFSHNQFTKAKKEGKTLESSLKGKSKIGKKHSNKTKKLLSKLALSSSHRRLKRNCIEYNGILLDSTWEVELAKRLDHLSIKWIRPHPLKWKDENGILRNYFPDFYLPEFDMYLDPKNSYAYRVQKKKIDILTKLYPNIKWILSLEECKTFRPIVKGI